MKHLELKVSSGELLSISIPENWNELNKKQILYIGLLWQSWQLMLQNGADMQVAKAKLFTALVSDKTPKELKKIIDLFTLTDFESIDFNPLELVNFVFENNNLTSNRFKEIRCSAFSKLYGPDDKLSNVTINEFSFAINYYNRYNSTGNISDLNLFVACLYRPKNKNWKETGDIRKPFIIGTVGVHLKTVEKMPFEYKQAIYLFFTGCMDFLAKSFPMVFQRSEDAGKSNQTFLDVILSMAGGKFGNFDQTKDQNAFLIFKDLNNLLLDQAKNKDK